MFLFYYLKNLITTTYTAYQPTILNKKNSSLNIIKNDIQGRVLTRGTTPLTSPKLMARSLEQL